MGNFWLTHLIQPLENQNIQQTVSVFLEFLHFPPTLSLMLSSPFMLKCYIFVNLFIVLVPGTLVVPTAVDLTPVPGTVSEAPDVIATTEKIAPQEAASTPAPVPEATEAAVTTEEAPSLTEEAPSSSTEAPVIQSDDQIETAAPTDAPKSEEAGPEEMATTEALTEDKEPTAQPEIVEETGSESPNNVEIEGEEG